MGHYLAIQALTDDQDAVVHVLNAISKSHLFQPVSMGGIDFRSDEARWLLSGHALEAFVSQYLWKCANLIPNVVVLESQPEERAYLARIHEAIVSRLSPAPQFSPVEVVYDGLPVTSVAVPFQLSDSVIRSASNWFLTSSQAGIEVFGHFLLSLSNDEKTQDVSAFRIVRGAVATDHIPIAVPLLMLTIDLLSHNPVSVKVGLYSEVSVWVQQRNELGRYVSPDQADLNLARLREVATQVIGCVNPIQVELAIGGLSFQLEAARLQAAFQTFISE